MKLEDKDIKILKYCNYKSKYQEKYESWWNRKEYWHDIQIKYRLNSKFIIHFSKYLDFELLSSTQHLSENVIEKFSDKVDWYNISMSQILSEEFIEKFEDKVDWNNISWFQNLSIEFLIRNKWKLNWSNVFRNKNITDEIKKDLINRLK